MTIILLHDYGFASHTAFHTSCKDSIVLPVLSGTYRSLLDSSRSERISRVNTPELEISRQFIALCICGSFNVAAMKTSKGVSLLGSLYRHGDLAGIIEPKGFLGREITQFYCAQLVRLFTHISSNLT